MKRKSRIYRVGALLLVLCFISTVMISGTFAKYTSEYSGQDTALVAKWSFTSSNLEAKGTDDTIAYLPIWDHKYTENIYEQDGDNYLIAPGIQGEFKVDFTYDADVDADLTFKFEKSGNTGNGNEAAKVPIQYSLNDSFTDVYYDLDGLADAIIDTAATNSKSTITSETGASPGEYIITDTATPKAENGEAGPIEIEQTVYWRWPYDVSKHTGEQIPEFTGTGAGGVWTDADDTKIGNDSQDGLTRDSYVLELEISATQKMPLE